MWTNNILAKAFSVLWVTVCGLSILSLEASAVLTPIGPGGFSASVTLVDFGPTQTFIPVNGQTIGGVTFGFTIVGIPSTDAIIDGGPGNTNNITIANIEGNTFGVLSMLFPANENRVGYGFAINTFGAVPNATRIELFDAANNSLGTLSANGAPDPLFAGGFLGVESTIPFLRANVTWNSGAADRFAFDNLRFESAPVAVPEPSVIILLGAGGLVMLVLRKHTTRNSDAA